ncbi:MAG TPA: RNA polymerase sigma factor [Candidatus Baltobacteraceae bacterium]|nr:RNA polymerase sigma factor [Candidatus Baltobacteraceae bacterium]
MGDSLFIQALAQHRSLMLKRARAIVRNANDAEDVVQEALERAWRSRERFTPGAQAAPWLLKITQNAALSSLRRRNGVQIVNPDDVIVRGGPDSDVLRQEHAQRIAGAIRELAPKHRQAFMLHDVQGYSSREISMHLHLPYHTVRTHLHRARLQLRGALTGGES